MTFRQERLVFDGDSGCDSLEKGDNGLPKYTIDNGILSPETIRIRKQNGWTTITEAEYLDSIAAEGWVLHTANYCVLGKQECHYFLFVKE